MTRLAEALNTLERDMQHRANHPALNGIHHVTAIAGDPQANIDFYTDVLGLRLVKLTVNFDSPNVYHLYYGDGAGNPGTILTFFPFPNAARGRRGTGMAAVVGLAIAPASLGYWIDRLLEQRIAYEGPTVRGEQRVIALRDPDGLALELVTSPGAVLRAPWERSSVPVEHQIRSVANVSLWERDAEPTSQFLTEQLGFRRIGTVSEAEGAVRYRVEGGIGGVDVRGIGEFWRGSVSAGTVHHVAWSTPDDATQAAWLERLRTHVPGLTPVQDRQYFRSIYFREPGGVLFEIATDTPGFAIDEDPDRLGTSLKLPEWYESHRQTIESSLPEIPLPDLAVAAE